MTHSTETKQIRPLTFKAPSRYWTKNPATGLFFSQQWTAEAVRRTEAAGGFFGTAGHDFSRDAFGVASRREQSIPFKKNVKVRATGISRYIATLPDGEELLRELGD
jgi:predicted phage gp36 major capsid-like protein